MMMLHIPDVLTSEEAADLRARLLAAPWVDGNATSGAGAAKAKRNRQLPEDGEAARMAQQVVSSALMESATFLSAALPHTIFPPLFNRYGVGETFGLHVDNAVRYHAATGARIRTVFNPFFQVADNLGTCWIVREEMTQDFIILNGDTIVSDEIVAKLVEGAQDAITVTVDVKPQGDYDDDDMKVSRDADGRLRAIGKRLLPPDTNAESIGMLAFTGEGPAIFRNQIDQMMRTPEGVERWYLRAIDIIAKGNRVGTVSIEGLEWQEVDFPQDVEAAQALTAKWIAQGRYAR